MTIEKMNVSLGGAELEPFAPFYISNMGGDPDKGSYGSYRANVAGDVATYLCLDRHTREFVALTLIWENEPMAAEIDEAGMIKPPAPSMIAERHETLDGAIEYANAQMMMLAATPDDLPKPFSREGVEAVLFDIEHSLDALRN